jgi:hypothetical protein
MTFAGIDIDTNSIHVVRLELDSDEARYDRVRLDVGPGDYHQRARRLRDLMPTRGAWKDDGVVTIAYEDPRSAAFKAAVPLAVVRGALLACLPRDVPVVPLTPQDWKKWTLGGGFPGQGNATKDDVAAWVRDHWPNRPPAADQNALDAYAIAWAARAMCDHHGVNPKEEAA